MYALMKRDLPYHPAFWLLAVILIIIMLILNFSPGFILFVYSMAFILSTFIYDRQNHMLFTVVSLPISRTEIVKSRYIFTIIVVFSISFILAFFGLVIDSLNLINFQTSLQEMIFYMSFTFILLAILMPIFYIFKNLYLAGFIIMVLGIFSLAGLFSFTLTTGTMYDISQLDKVIVLNLSERFNNLTTLMVILAVAFYYLSYAISASVFREKDL